MKSNRSEEIFPHVQMVFDEFIRNHHHDHYSISKVKDSDQKHNCADNDEIYIFTLHLVQVNKPYGNQSKVLNVTADKNEILHLEELVSK